MPTFLQQKLKPCEGDVVEVYDAYYADNEQYNYIANTLKSILSDVHNEVKMITDYVSEDKAVEVESKGCPFSVEKIVALTDEDLYGN